MPQPQFLVRFWGARGSLPAPAAGNAIYGTDTSCVEMRCGDHVLVFDAGSGAESLGRKLIADGVHDLDLFFSHSHFDHILGLPFLKPLYAPGTTIRLHAGHFEDDMTCAEMVRQFMRPPFFPVTPSIFHADVSFRDFRPPQILLPAPDIAIRTARLRHPNGCVGYRVEFAGKSVCYVTDTEHVPGEPDRTILDLIAGADVLIYDCMYTDAEFPACRGFGHSTWEEGVRLCEAAGVRRMVISHHRPGRYDAELATLEQVAKARFGGSIVGRTGLEIAP